MKCKPFFTLGLLILMVACSNTDSNKTPGSKESTFYSGNGVPSNSLGNQYDHYLDLDSKYVYEKNGGLWYNKYSLGSEVLLDATKRNRNNSSINEQLKQALCNTFYSTNISYHYSMQQPHSEYDSSLRHLIDFEINKDQAHITSFIGESNAEIYYRVEDNKDQYYYIDMTDGFVDVDNPNLYCSFPFPSIENTPHCYYGIEDSVVGEFNAMVVSRLSDVIYNEETGYYIINNISGSHSGINYKGWTISAGNVTFNAKFKLSEDMQYISVIDVTITESPSFLYNSEDRFVMEFYNYHNTKVVLPI